MRILPLLAIAACAASVPQETPTDVLASRLKASIAKMQKRVKLGVLPLTDSSGDVYVLGEYLAENLVTALAGADGYDVIERSRLDQVLKESELSASNLLRDDAIISVGKLLGADALVIGTFTVFGDEVAVNCRLVEVATGRILGTAQTKLPRAHYAELLATKRTSTMTKATVPTNTAAEEPPPPTKKSAKTKTTSTTSDGAYKAGQRVEISWGGTWYPGVIVESRGDVYHIHYDGYGTSSDEWVGPDRLRTSSAKASSVEVLWNGNWYPAEVRERKDGRFRIHYTGYSDSWDEWVGRDRIRGVN